MSAYGTTGRYPDNVDLEKHGVLGRLKVAVMGVQQHRRSGDQRRLARSLTICDELLDRLLEVQGRRGESSSDVPRCAYCALGRPGCTGFVGIYTGPGPQGMRARECPGPPDGATP